MKALPVVFCAAVLAPAAALAAVPRNPLPVAVEGEVLVRYRDAADRAPAMMLKATLGMQVKRRFDNAPIELLRVPSMMPVAEALELLAARPEVEYAEPNFRRYTRAVIPNDPLFPQQWGLRNTGQPNFVLAGPAGLPGADLNLPEAWDANGDGTANRIGLASEIVAIIDTAIETGHEDLVANMLPGRDLAEGDDNPNPDSADQMHGTAVAGCVGARGNNGVGVAGAAWNVSLLPLKISRIVDRDGVPDVVIDSAAAVAAYDYARDNGARVVNASFGGPTFSQAERDMIRSIGEDGVLFVAAGGNDDSNTDKGQINYPANYDATNILSVAATNRQDTIASFSQYGPLSTDVAAPGLQIVTAGHANSYTASPTGITGTSFAAPYTAGIAALIRSHVTGATLRDVRARLVESGERGQGPDPEDDTRLRTVGGRIDADRALDMAPGPSLAIRSVALRDGGNAALDPGESLVVDVAIRNHWQAATNVVATLIASAGVTVTGPALALGAFAADQEKTASFNIAVAPSIADHRYVFFTLALSADGGYAARRSFVEEIGRLHNAVTAAESFVGSDVDLYDEFHAWHFDLAQPAAELRFTTTAGADIDLLVKRGTPPQYNITVGINPETENGFFCTSGTTPDCLDPATLIGGEEHGNETVSIANAPAGTYYLVVVNFAQRAQALPYTLRAEISPATPPPSPAGGGGGGGAFPALLLLLLLPAGMRHARQPHGG